MRAPVLAVGDGALGFWAAVRDVFPETTEQRCCSYVSANVLDALPKSSIPIFGRLLDVPVIVSVFPPLMVSGPLPTSQTAPTVLFALTPG